MKLLTQMALDQVLKEMQNGEKAWGKLTTMHYGYAVLQEEIDELWTAIKLQDKSAMRDEAKQVAAIAIRLMLDFP